MLANGGGRLLNGVMNNPLVPITEINALEASRSLLVSLNLDGNQRLLRSRNMSGVLQRYGDNLDDAQRYFESAQEQHQERTLGAFALRGAKDGEIIGMATIYPGLRLRQLHLPVPPAIAKGPLVQKHDTYDASIAAWAIGSNGREDLRRVYLGVADLALNSLGKYIKSEARPTGSMPFLWTTEPTDSPHFHFVYKVIKQAGLLPEKRPKRYDDAESRKRIPPVSQLYISRLSTITSR